MEINLSQDKTQQYIFKDAKCPNCGSQGMRVFYEVRDIPVHNVMLVYSKQEAISYPRGDMELGFCDSCGFISNLAFDLKKLEYSTKCEETQGFSSTFNLFHRNLAQKLIGKYNLFNKQIIEIGCGKGEFLNILCELGNNKGVGFDPAYVSERNHSTAKEQIVFIGDLYSEKYSDYKADFICCKMTLEHIPNTFEFISMLRRSVGDDPKTVLFFQVPDVTRVLKEFGFWDIYYEHCSYFTPASLSNLFLRAGFEIIDLYRSYEDQYLMLECRPSSGIKLSSPLQPVEDLNEIYRLVSYFSTGIIEKFASWKREIAEYYSSGKKIVIWGGGSKAVSFITTLGIKNEIGYVTDINPYKNGTYILGAGQRVVSPGFLKDYEPDIILVMNPIYMDEIRMLLNDLGLKSELRPVTAED